MRIPLNIWLIFLLSVPETGIAGTHASWQFPLVFDLGPAGQKTVDHAVEVDPGDRYSGKKGYGLSGKDISGYRRDSSFFYDHLTMDGITSTGRIDFRVLLGPGDYKLFISMDGGEKTTWRGEILINGKLVETQLHRFEENVEEESPPDVWVILKDVRVDREGPLTVSVVAEGQPATLSVLKIFRAPRLPVRLKEGKYVTSENFLVPNGKFIIELLNKGAITEARKNISAIPEQQYAREKAWLLMALAGRIETQDPRPWLEWAKELFKKSKQEKKHQGDDFNIEMIDLYGRADTWYNMAGWDWAKKYSDKSIFPRMDMAARLLLCIAGEEGYPLQDRARWEVGKIAFWAWVEEHADYTKEVADRQFGYLLKYYQDPLLEIYAGVRSETPDMEKEAEKYEGFPQWAVYEVMALRKVRDLIHYWVQYRQADNGEFGGKYDDDVEMLRWWWVARLAADDKATLEGLRKLVNGIWTSGWITNGFSKKLRDVEHSSEPVADTQPVMIGLDYGNPVYVERCMQSMKGIFGLWTGINQYGHRHFRSSWYSSTAIDTTPPKGCDVEMNTRTVKTLRWVAWYNGHPLARQFMREWGDAWLQDCQRTDKGKPYGIVPSAIRYYDDAIGGYSDNWYHPGLFWKYFDYTGGAKMMNQLFSTWLFTGDKKYLEPIGDALHISLKYSKKETEQAAPGSEAWVAGILKGSRRFRELLELWRNYTGDHAYDSILVKNGSDYLKFLITGDTAPLVDGCKKIIKGVTANWDLLTTEGYYTDRIEIGDLHKGEVWGVGTLESMYLGNAVYDGFYPYYTVSWENMGDDFAALVQKSDRKEVKILTYNLSEKDRSGALFLWHLDPGVYIMNSTVLPAGTGEGGNTTSDTIVAGDHYAWTPVYLPAGKGMEISLVQLRRSQKDQEALPDLAITGQELQITDDIENGRTNITLPVHNIGIKDVENIRLILMHDGKIIQAKTLDRLEAPLDLNARKKEVTFSIGQKESGIYRIVADPEDHLREITEVNNAISFQLKNNFL